MGAALAVRDVCGHWDGFLKKMSHRLRADLGVDVQPGLTNAEKQNHELRISNLHGVVLSDSRLTGSLKVKNAASEISIDVLLPARAVRFGIEIKAPTVGRQSCAAFPAMPMRNSLQQTRCRSRSPSNGRRTCREARGRSTAAILDGIMIDLEKFYRQVVEGIVAFVPPAPKLPGVAVSEGNAVAEPAPPEPEPPAESGEMLINAVPVMAEPRLPSQPALDGPVAEPDRAVNE